MRVWVVMGNDFPHSAHKTEEGAQGEIEKKKAERGHSSYPPPRIYWRAYEFDLKE